MKLILGGTFDPVHQGHIQLALHLAAKYQQVVSLLPLGGLPSYKATPQANLAQRLAMLELVVKAYPGQIEIDYSEAAQETYSPSYVTLHKLRQIHGTPLPIFFIIGGDSLLTLDSWDNWHKLFSLSNFIVALRPDYSLSAMSAELSKHVMPRMTNHADLKQPAGQIILTNFKPLAVSSSQIRHYCANQQAIDDLVLPEVADYIYTHNLYQRNSNA